MLSSDLCPFLVLIPLGVAFIILMLGPKHHAFARVSAVASTGLLLLVTILLGGQVLEHGTVFYHFGGWAPPLGIEFLIDSITAFFLLIVSFISLITMIFGAGVLHKEVKEEVLSYYYALFLILLASLMGIAASNDFFNIFVFLEISAVSAAALVAVNGNRLAMEAAVKYLILSTLGSGTVLLSIANIYLVTGHLNLTFVSEALFDAYQSYPLNILATLGLIMVGLTVKAALYPLHVWLPDAHGSAPTTSSAVLSGLVVKVYIVVFFKLIFRVFPLDFIETLPIQMSLLFMSTLGILVGSVLAIRQSDIKKMLAYSTVAQIGYVFLGLGLLTYHGVLGALLHILNHAVMKAMLFLSAGLIIKLTGKRKLSELSGVGRVYPLPMVAFSLGALAMVGIPPLNGFVSKWYLGLGALDAGRPFYVLVILISSFLNGLYYLPIVIQAFFGSDFVVETKQSISLGPSLALIVLSFATVFFGFFSSIPAQFIAPAVRRLFQG